MGVERNRKKRAAQNAQENLEVRFLVEELREMVSEPVCPCLRFLGAVFFV